jgi:nucleoside-diphosphate-sugar epimerase
MGINERNSDNALIQKYLGWKPSIRLRDGMEMTMSWIERQMPA